MPPRRTRYKSYARRTTGGANRQKRAREICRAIAQCGRANKYFDLHFLSKTLTPNSGAWITAFVTIGFNTGNFVSPVNGSVIDNREGRRIDVHRFIIEVDLILQILIPFAILFLGGDWQIKFVIIRDKQIN